MLKQKVDELLNNFGITLPENGKLHVTSPIDGSLLGTVVQDDFYSINNKVEYSKIAQKTWQKCNMQDRAQFLSSFVKAVEDEKAALSEIMAVDAPKTPDEAVAEVGNFITTSRDMITRAVKEDEANRLADEVYLGTKKFARSKNIPAFGVADVTTSFNFPLGVFSWSAAPMMLMGNAVVWKPSEKVPLVALAVKNIWDKNCDDNAPELKDLLQVVIGGKDASIALAMHDDITILDVTGSAETCEALSKMWEEKRARLLARGIRVADMKGEGGGNNGFLVSDQNTDKELDDAAEALAYCALSGGGFKCTDGRRAIVHEVVYDKFLAKVIAKYKAFIAAGNVKNPLEGPANKYGYAPLPDKPTFEMVEKTKQVAVAEGGKQYFGERVLAGDNGYENAYYLNPAIMEMPTQTPIMFKECFGPVLFITKCASFEAGLAMTVAPENAGLSNAVYTHNPDEIARFAEVNGPLAGHGSANMPTGTGTPAHRMGFGGKRKSGFGVNLEYDAGSPFSHYQNHAATTRFVRFVDDDK